MDIQSHWRPVVISVVGPGEKQHLIAVVLLTRVCG